MDRTGGPDPIIRRRACGDFLRSRRERLSPSDVGLPSGTRRRTPGLRREEVALLAGVGTTWYSWLEQGRDVRPSVGVLEALADALRLDIDERRHLFLLQDRPPPERKPAGDDAPDPSLERLLAGLVAQPAFVVGRRWDIVAWNTAARLVLGDFGRLQGDERNALHLMFADTDYPRLFVDWEGVARPALAMFRADCARELNEPDVRRLIERLAASSPAFAGWWAEMDVARPVAADKLIRHPVVGEMLLQFSTLSVPDGRVHKVVVLTPGDEVSTGKLSTLLAR